MNIPEHIKWIMERLVNNGYEAYIVGGAVRDYFLKVEPHDYDIFTNATGEQILKVFEDCKTKIIGGEERQAKVLTVILTADDGEDVEISQFRSSGDRTETGNTLEEHQATCDFTMNALAVDINGELCGDEKITQQGRMDIGRKILRFVGKEEDRIKEDPLRVLRALRFTAKYNLKQVYFVLGDYYLNMVKELPKERIRDELLKIFTYSNTISGNLFHLLEGIMPFFYDTRDIAGGSHHVEAVQDHMIFAYEEACKITDNPLLRLAAFAHDCGKHKTISQEEVDRDFIGAPIEKDGRVILKGIVGIHFYEHEKVGAEIIEDWMLEYKFSHKEIDYVSTLVRLHMYSYKDKPSKKSYLKFFNKLNEAEVPIIDYVMLLYSDHQGNKAKPRIKFGDFVKGNFLLQHYWELTYTKEPFKVSNLVVGGKDLIASFGMSPGPEIGELLNKLHNLVMDGELQNTRSDLLWWLKENV